jgi:hypothetical protein
MPHIRSANPDFKRIDAPSSDLKYIHGADVKKTVLPMAFQVTSPFDFTRAIMPHALVLHVNPASFNETFNKKIERIQTTGGWVEQHWGDDLSEVSADGSTGAFMNIYTGLSSVLRRRTIAYDRYRDLHDLFRHNGSVYDPYGNIVLQGQVLLMFDRGTLAGTFRTFEFEETADSPFTFKLNWTFKVEHILYYIPGAGSGKPLYGPAARVPSFQMQNTEKAPNAVAQAETEAKAKAKAKAQAEEDAKKAYTELRDAAVGAWNRGSEAVRGFLETISKSPEQRTAEEQAQAAAAESQALTDSLARQRREQFNNRTTAPTHTASSATSAKGKR